MNLNKLRVLNVGPLGGVNQLYGLNDLIYENLNKDSHVAEIGTYCGVSTSLFAETCEKVVAVDKRFMECLKNVLEDYSNIEFLNMRSEEAVSLFDDGIFDAVYIDACHDYEFVKQDIELWMPKVKSGGILCGHDYITDEIASRVEFDWFGKKMGYGGVKKAVDEKFKKVKIYKDSSWMVKL